jgi:histidinol dehydrogenase
VRRHGDKALVRLIRQHDKIHLAPKNFRVPLGQIKGAIQKVGLEVRRAMEACARRIGEFHYQEKRHITQSWTFAKDGVRLGQIYNPVGAVGIYVPGGRFSYPSTLLMTAIPARLAGVERIVVLTPPTRMTNEILAAAHIAGVDEVYRVGGPGGIAALCYGTKTIPKVDLIVGPGNALVTEAKRQLFGEVGIDLLAGPSELVVLADESAPAPFVAADLAAQAEHDPESRAVLISLDRKLLEDVRALLPKDLITQCELIYQSDRGKAIAKTNDLAAEHVQIMLKRPQDCLDTLKNGGTFFINTWSPAVMGDYWAGSSHVLPTGRSARFASGLSVMTFLKRSSLVEISAGAFKKGFQPAHQMAEVEGLNHHAHSLRVRINEDL